MVIKNFDLNRRGKLVVEIKILYVEAGPTFYSTHMPTQKLDPSSISISTRISVGFTWQEDSEPINKKKQQKGPTSSHGAAWEQCLLRCFPRSLLLLGRQSLRSADARAPPVTSPA